MNKASVIHCSTKDAADVGLDEALFMFAAYLTRKHQQAGEP